MKKKEYMEIEKDSKTGTIILLVIIGMIIIGALYIDYYGI